MENVDLGISFKDTNGREPAEIDVGSTGMYLIRQVHSHNWQIHFFPEDNKHSVAGKERHYALLFLSGLASLVDWWTSSENPDPLNTQFDFVTNQQQLDFMKKNLGTSALSIINNTDSRNIQGTLNLMAVITNGRVLQNLSQARRLFLSEG